MQSRLNKCDKCPKLIEFIDKKILYTDSAINLAIDVNEFIKNCECEETIDGECKDRCNEVD